MDVDGDLMKYNFDSLIQEAKRYGVDLSDKQLQQFELYYELLV